MGARATLEEIVASMTQDEIDRLLREKGYREEFSQAKLYVDNSGDFVAVVYNTSKSGKRVLRFNTRTFLFWWILDAPPKRLKA